MQYNQNKGYKNPGQIGTDANLENNLNGYNLDMAKGSDYMGRPQQEPSNYDELDESLLRNNNSYNPNNQAPQTNRTVPSNIELSEIEIELFNRLLKTGIIRASPNIKTLHDRKIVILDAQSTMKFQNGVIFAGYLIVLKEVLYKHNQDFAIDQHVQTKLKEQSTPQARLFNWNFLCNELDKIGVIIENDIKSLYVAGDSEEIGRLFTRIERYMKRISGDVDILNFNEYRKDDRKFNKSNVADLENSNGGRRGLQTNQKKPVKDGVDIMQMDISKDPSQTESTLEFILNTLCRALNMKPKQAAALLTNNNQFLTHCCVKGVKSQFEPMKNWYHEIYQYSRHLSMMLEVEIQNAIASGDPKQIRAAQQNFDKVLQTISCGCYSHNFEVAQTCMKTLSCIAQDFNGNIELVHLITKWFESKDNGIYTINYALKRHQDLAEEFVNCIGNFTNDGDQMTWVYMGIMQGFYPDMVEYFNTMSHLFGFLSIKYSQELPKGTLLSQLIERGIGYADNDPVNTPQVRIAAMALINEIWLEFPIYIEKQSNYSNPIQHVYKKNSRERIRSVRIVTAVCMFKLLDKFSAEKNPSAPAILKSLVFSLVESPQDQTVRELYLTNFQYLFEQVKSIPVGLIVDPFVKSNQVQDTFQFQTFDYDFFTFLAGHPKLTVQNAIQMLDLLARQYLNDVCSASAAAVPFMLLSSRFLGTIQCQEFIMKFITISLNQLLQIDPQETRSTPGNTGGKQKVLALPAPGVRGSSSSLKGKDFRIQSNKKSSQKAEMINTRHQTQEEEISSRLKKAQIITMLLKIQNLLQEDVNNAMRDMLLGAQKQYKDQNNGYLSNGIMAVLKYWGDPDHMFNQYLKRQEKIEGEEKKAYERLQRQEQIERRMLGYDSDEKPPSQGGQAYQSLANGRSLKNGRANGRNSMALMPITENTQNLRAMHELEMIRKYKKDKEDEEKAKQGQLARKQTVKEKQLKEQLQKRRIEIGVAENVKGVKQEIKALIYKEDVGGSRKAVKYRNPIEASVQLIDLNQEEDRDREIIVAFMKRNGKIWKFLFGRYANQCYSSKQQNNFDDIGKKTSQISLAEITKMLKDLNTYPILLSKEELASVIRLINMGSKSENSSDLAMLDYAQFIQFIPQLALFSFSRAPINKSHLPPIESLNALLTQFEQATRDRGKSTQIYEDPDHSSMKDTELMQALDIKINQDPNYPVPEGYIKVTEKMPIYTYKVPQCAAKLLKESNVMATEMMDEILFEVLGMHFLEPQIKFDVRYKVKQTIKKQVKPAEALGYMKKVEKKQEDLTQKQNANHFLSAAEKRRLEFEIKPKLQLAQKLQVMKQDLKTRPHWQEVAEVFEEMLGALEKGQDKLADRVNRQPGQIQNEVKLMKAQNQVELKETGIQREGKRQHRDQYVKGAIKVTNFGGRGLDINAYKKQEGAYDKEDKERDEKQERLEFRQQAKLQKMKYDKLKSKNIDELKKKKEYETLQNEIEFKMAEKMRKEFLYQQRQKQLDGYKETANARDHLLVKKEKNKEQEDRQHKKIENQMKRHIKNSKPDRVQEKQERQDVDNFMNKPDVVAVFKTYEKPLLMMYKFYASQEQKSDAQGFDLDYLHNVLSFKELIRWGYQQNVTPNFVSPEQMVKIYKKLVRETEDSQDQDFNIGQKTYGGPSDTLKGAKTLKVSEIQQQILDKYREAHKKSGFIDFDAFKKAIVRISVMAQEKLDPNATNTDEDLLKKDLQAKAKKTQKKKMLDQIKEQDDKKKMELEQLREQFDEEQKYKEKMLDKNFSKNKKAQKIVEPLTYAQHKRKEENQYKINQAKLVQEEEFFNKWLKQRENLGAQDVQESDQPLASARTINHANPNSLKKKNMTKKELDDLDKQLKEQIKINNLKIDEKQVRNSVDVSIISASTIEAFIIFLELKEDDREIDVNMKLNNTMMNRKSTVRSPKPNGGKNLKNSDFHTNGVKNSEQKAKEAKNSDFDATGAKKSDVGAKKSDVGAKKSDVNDLNDRE